MSSMRAPSLRIVLLLPCAGLMAQPAEQAEFFESRVRPILATHCQSCHGSKQQMAGLDLSSAAGLAKGSDRGPVALKGDAEGSRLIRAVRYQGKIKMPPAGKLSEQQIADLTAWVSLGAPWPAEKSALQSEQRAFWSFQRPTRVSPPQVRDGGWVQTPIDKFILARLEEKGVKPASRADKLTLLRRATYDLTGLPPAPQDIREFLADESPDAYRRLVERLLDSPRYGERWGRHWLDVARYADSTGVDEDHKYPYAWKYRDYVIDAFNRDLAYDRFVREQVAGDLLPPERGGGVNVRGVIATGFLALGPKLIAEQDKPKMLYDIVDEQIEVTGKAFLGLTINCARCHDHKFDPISTKDYYALAGIFASTRQLEDVQAHVSTLYYAPLVEAEVYAIYRKRQEKIGAARKKIANLLEEEAERQISKRMLRIADYMVAARNVSHRTPAGLEDTAVAQWREFLKSSEDPKPYLDRWFRADEGSIASVAAEYQKQFENSAAERFTSRASWRKQFDEAVADGRKPPEEPRFNAGEHRFFQEVTTAKGPFALSEKQREDTLSAPLREKLAALRTEWEAAKKASPPEPPMACGVAEGDPVRQRVFVRGNPANQGDEVPKRFPLILAGNDQPPIASGSGRLELARWLSAPSNPLTARVMVNRIWQWHFGEGIVRTPNNFGQLGQRPTHPELLDWLAQKFVDSNWSIKAMHRLIMLSSAYQMSSEISADKAVSDPANQLLSRFDRRRMDVEEMRDTLLGLEGALDLKMGGTLQEGTGTEKVPMSVQRLGLNPDESTRRTVYLPLRRSNIPALLNLFDFGDATTTSEGRSRTNIAPQALFMMNSGRMARTAEAIARRLLGDAAADDNSRLEQAWYSILIRPPSETEVREGLEYIRGFESIAPGPDARMRAWKSYCRILLSSNDFIYLN